MESADHSMLLEMRDAFVAYGKHTYLVLKGVTLRVEKGRIVCLIGPNGAGKSTALRTMFGLLKPEPGQVIYKGEDVTGRSPADLLRRGMAFVFQESSVFPSMTVYENLEMGVFIHKDKSKFHENLGRVYSFFPILKEKEQSRAGTMSGGQRRMLEVGRALLLEPDLLLLDEPSVGLSPKIQEAVFEKIVDINRNGGVTIVMVEQNARRALEISDYAYLLVDGTNRAEGPAREILGNTDIRKLYLGG
jgi:ABC-type branched-subunit amino acid transport system ATPase component